MQPYILSNLHTHSTFCDGAYSPEDNVREACAKKIKTLGFTSHSMYPFWTETYMKVEDFSSYCAEIRRLKAAYASELSIRLGFEADFIPGVTVPRFEHYAAFAPDFLIGSVHFIFQRDGMFAVDNTVATLREGVQKYYKGDMRALVGDYFALEREMLERGDFSFVGHPDLIRKFNDTERLFDETESWYKNELKECAKAIAKSGRATEINTGAMSRGYMTKPYPSEYFLSVLHEHGVPIVINSDAHSKENLDYAFAVARQCAKKAGYREVICDIDKAGYTFCALDD